MIEIMNKFVDEAKAANKVVDVTNHMCQEIRTSSGIVSLALTPEFWKKKIQCGYHCLQNDYSY